MADELNNMKFYKGSFIESEPDKSEDKDEVVDTKKPKDDCKKERTRYEYYVSGAKRLNLDGKVFNPGDVVPENLVSSFYLVNGHISKRILEG